MNKKILVSCAAVLALIVLTLPSASAQQHRATRLGNPATRFAKPLTTPEDLRAMLRSESLRADVDYIARESGFVGNVEDLRQAAATANILPLKIPVGTLLPAMSTRKNGKAVLLRDVLWAGKEPIDAYEFYFTSQGRRYRLVSPKACANFWVEDYGKELKPALTLDCDAPGMVALRRPVQVCLVLKNTGDEIEPLATVTLPIPAGATFTSATEGGKVVNGSVVWDLPNVAAGSSSRLCTVFSAPQIGSLPFASTARGQVAAPVASQCATRVTGVPAVLLEVIDIADPIEVGSNETYEITVLNQGSATLTNVKLICTLENGQEFVSATGTTPMVAQEHAIHSDILPVLNSKDKASWRVVVKTLTTGDVRFTTELSSDQFPAPVMETESTQQY